MLSTRLTLIAMLVPLMLQESSAALAPKVPVVVCPRVEKAPVLDGNLAPGEWAAAGRLTDFVLVGGKGLPTRPTRVCAMHTAEGLYIGAQLDDDDPVRLTANATERDGAVYEDDCFELFIDTDGSRKHYAHLVVNSLGTRFDAYDRDVAENFEWNVFAAVNETGWAVELHLPFDQAVPPLAGEIWNLGVCRNVPRAGELSAWGRHERGFHEPEAFGEMVFAAPLLTGTVDDMGDLSWGDNLGLVTIENLTDTTSSAKVCVVAMGADRRSHYFGTVKKTVGPRERAQVYVPYRIRRCGPAWVTFSITDEKGTTAWRSAALPVDLPDFSDPLDGASHEIAGAWRGWSALPPSSEKDTLRANISALQEQWRYLDEQSGQAQGWPRGRLAILAIEAQQLRDAAAAVHRQVRAEAGLKP